MDCNKDEAIRAKGLAETMMQNRDFLAARRMARKAQQLFPGIENISQMLTVCEVHCSAGVQVEGEMNWYKILQVEPTADDSSIKKQFRQLAILLNPDKNKLAGAEEAFKLIVKAHYTLSIRAKADGHDVKVNEDIKTTTQGQQSHQAGETVLISEVKQGQNSAKPMNSDARQKKTSSLALRPNESDDIDSENLAIKIADTPTKTFAPKSVPRRSERLNKKNSDNKVGSEDGDTKIVSRTTKVFAPTFTPQKSTRLKKNASSNEVESQYGNNGFVNPPRTKKQRSHSSVYSDEHNKKLSHEIETGEEMCDIRTDVASKRKKHSQLQKGLQHGKERMEGCERWSGMKEEKSGEMIQCSSNNSSEVRTFCYPDPEFCDFDKSRSAGNFAADQIWATYDNKDGMPRFYAQIKQVQSPEFKVHFNWLEHNPGNEYEIAWSDEELPVACGNYSLGASDVSIDLQMFSHLVTGKKGKKKNSYDIYPKVGQVWALFKDWSIGWSSDSDNHKNYNYEVVEVISDFSVNSGTKIIPLVKIEGFVSLFVRAEGKKGAPVVIPASEILRFSHCIPAYRLSGTERKDIPANSMELDSASLPVCIKKVVPSTSLGCRKGNVDKPNRHSNSCFKATKESDDSIKMQHIKRKSQKANFGGVDMNVENAAPLSPTMFEYPGPEFCNFDKFRSIENFYRGQIWALYSDIDKYPKYYGWIRKVELENRRLHVVWLESCPLEEEEMRWISEEMPVSCGTFKFTRNIMVFGRSEFFSHPVHMKRIGKNGHFVILPNSSEVWAIYKNWKAGWSRSDLVNCEYDVVQICEATDSGIKVLPLTRVAGYKAVFKSERTGNAPAILEIPADEYIRFSHQIPAHRLTDESGGKLQGYWELDTAALPDHLLS